MSKIGDRFDRGLREHDAGLIIDMQRYVSVTFRIGLSSSSRVGRRDRSASSDESIKEASAP
jgi:hypothetical protein